MKSPYSRVAIVEFGASAGVAYAGKLFADLGAEVTKIELPGDGLKTRRIGLRDDVATTMPEWFAYLNAGKRTMALTNERVRGEMHRLLAASSILFHAERDTKLTEHGLTPEAIAQEFPRLVVAAISPFGLKGHWRTLPAADITLQAMGGISLGIGLPGRAPLKLPGDQSAYQSGLAAAIAAAGALFSRRGALIDVAAADVWAAFYTGVEVANAHFGRQKKPRAGHRVSRQPYPRTIFRCRDGYFAIQCGENHHWQSFLRMVERGDLQTHPLFANRFAANDEHGDECDALFEPWFLARSKHEILELCLQHKIPGAPVYNIDEVVAHPHLRERGYFVTPPSVAGKSCMPTHPFSSPSVPQSADGQRRTADNAIARTRALCDRHLGASDTARPLAGLRVVDFGWVWAGAVPGHVLADLGAEVIKVESLSPLDYMRQGRPLFGTKKDPEQNPMFHAVNRGKLSLHVDLSKLEATEVLKELVAKSDIVIENFSPGVMEKFGLDWRALRGVKEDLIMCSMSAVGQHGPLRGIRTYATMIAALCGLDSVVGYPNQRVLGSQSSYADPNASLHAVFAILASLWHREQTGEGGYIDLSQWEAAVSVMSEQVIDYLSSGRVPLTCGTQHPSNAPHGNYPVQGDDQWVAIAIEDDAQWNAFARVLGSPSWMSEAEFSTRGQRLINCHRLDTLLTRETAKYDAQPLVEALLNAGIPAARLLDAPGVAGHPYFQARGLFQLIEHPVLKTVPTYRLPWHIDGRPVAIARRAPLLGEHNDYVLNKVLGITEERASSLRSVGALA